MNLFRVEESVRKVKHLTAQHKNKPHSNSVPNRLHSFILCDLHLFECGRSGPGARMWWFYKGIITRFGWSSWEISGEGIAVVLNLILRVMWW